MTSNDLPSPSRRQIVGVVGTGLAAAAAGAAQAQEPSAAAQQPLTDPIGKFPAPPFKRQSQPWPGLAGRMDPKPDHGETSYRGSGRLARRDFAGATRPGDHLKAGGSANSSHRLPVRCVIGRRRSPRSGRTRQAERSRYHRRSPELVPVSGYRRCH